MELDERDLKAPGSYIVAVSGGVDSVSLLAALTDAFDGKSEFMLIVAHVDHGMRADSAQDGAFVRQLANDYNLVFEQTNLKLGPKASEATARQKRYKFLSALKKKYDSNAVITAHHQDDVLETAIINLIRGTNRKGLGSLRSHPGLIRPLLRVSKQELISYAIAHKLEWRDDVTNLDASYLRNYVRQILLSRFQEEDKQRLLELVHASWRLNEQIDGLLDQISHQILISSSQTEATFKRSSLVELDQKIALEFLAQLVRRFGSEISSAVALKQLWLFIKTAQHHKQFELHGGIVVTVDKNAVVRISTSRL